MRALSSAALVVLLAACPSSSLGPQGEEGPQGPAGAQGAQGPKGDRGDTGSIGPIGATGTQGATGEQGVQGPAGSVLVLDGGVVVGPPGSSVIVTPIPVGGATCPTGGIRVTQVSDGGISNVCNGALGPQGPAGAQGPAGPIGATGSQGPAGSQGVAGAQGPAGPQGAQGASVTVTVLASMSPQCMTGGVRIGYPDGGSSAVCNGDQGPQGIAGVQGMQGNVGPQGSTGAQGAPGAAGPAGVAGPSGPMGATGPSGPPGAVFFVDGGTLNSNVIAFAGFTSTQYTGNLGGTAGANQKCDAAFPGSYFCSDGEFARSESSVVITASGAWVDFERDDYGRRSNSACYVSGVGGWTNATNSDTALTLNALGETVNSLCNVSRPIACCRRARAIVFRGFTSALFNGNLGGISGANQKCTAQYAGSYFCSAGDYARSEAPAIPGGDGAWVDFERDDYSRRSNASCYVSGVGGWSNATTTDTALTLNALGETVNSLCNVARPLACCQNN